MMSTKPIVKYINNQKNAVTNHLKGYRFYSKFRQELKDQLNELQK